MDDDHLNIDEEDAPPFGERGEDVHNDMIEMTFNLSAYISRTNNEDNEDDDDESDEELDETRNRGGTSCQGWTYLTESNRPEVFISVDGVDKRLLDRAREEVPAVLMKIKKKLGFRRDRNICTLLPGDCLRASMDT